MASRRLKQRERVENFRRQNEEAEKEFVSRIIQRRPTIKLGKTLLKFRFCETTGIFDGKQMKTTIMVEFTEHGPTCNINYLYSFGMDSLGKQIGIRFYCVQIIRTVSNRYQIYISRTASPPTRRRNNKARKTVDSGFSTSRTSLSEDSTADDKHHPPALATVSTEGVDSKPPGAVVTRTFNGQQVRDVHFVRSQSSQTVNKGAVENDTPAEPIAKKDEESGTHGETSKNDAIVRKSAQPHTTVNDLSQQMSDMVALSRFNDLAVFDNVRKYLAYYQRHTDHGYRGETRLSLGVKIQSKGLPIGEELKSLYIKYLASKGYTQEEANSDLEQCRMMITSERLDYLNRVGKAARETFANSTGVIIRRSPHDVPVRTGRCDPECCQLM